MESNSMPATLTTSAAFTHPPSMRCRFAVRHLNVDTTRPSLANSNSHVRGVAAIVHLLFQRCHHETPTHAKTRSPPHVHRLFGAFRLLGGSGREKRRQRREYPRCPGRSETLARCRCRASFAHPGHTPRRLRPASPVSPGFFFFNRENSSTGSREDALLPLTSKAAFVLPTWLCALDKPMLRRGVRDGSVTRRTFAPFRHARFALGKCRGSNTPRRALRA